MRDIIKEELLRIADEHGGILRPADVVEAARPASSPLHSRFEWSDTKAAAAYRLWQARQLIAVTVEYTGVVNEPTNVFVSVASDRKTGGGYRTMVSIMSKDETRAELLRDAFEEMQRFKIKYRCLRQLAEVFAAMRKVAGKHRRKK